MTYTAPTVAQFKARFPYFADVPAETVQMILDEAISQVGETWYERDRATATLYLTAHLLAVEGWGGSGGGGGAGGGGAAVTGTVKKRKVGDVEVEFAGPSLTNGGGSGSVLDQYKTTMWGQRFVYYMKLNFPAVAVV